MYARVEVEVYSEVCRGETCVRGKGVKTSCAECRTVVLYSAVLMFGDKTRVKIKGRTAFPSFERVYSILCAAPFSLFALFSRQQHYYTRLPRVIIIVSCSVRFFSPLTACTHTYIYVCM